MKKKALYFVLIILIARNKKLKSNIVSREYYFKFYESHFKLTIPPEEAERIIKNICS